MKVIVVGATGTIGSAIVRNLSGPHEVISVSQHQSEIKVDISDIESIKRMFTRIGKFDALISAAGPARFGALQVLQDEDFDFSLRNKLMGQVNLVRYGLDSMNDKGSFTLTSGVLGRSPVPGTPALSLVNGGLESFVRAAALDLPRGIRINIVSPGWISETLQQMGKDPATGTPADTVAQDYLRCLEGNMNGTTVIPA
jgi:NAD(P)-dependent dehydrogenase (short-subunit alcohol dehydrogenase family)